VEKRGLGRTGLLVSPIALGGAAFAWEHKATGRDPRSEDGRRKAIATINAALDRGINYIDIAPASGDGDGEMLIGEVMRARRQVCVLASKVWYELDRQGAVDSVHASLKRLNTDRIDILQDLVRAAAGGPVQHVLDWFHIAMRRGYGRSSR